MVLRHCRLRFPLNSQFDLGWKFILGDEPGEVASHPCGQGKYGINVTERLTFLTEFKQATPSSNAP